MERIDFIAGRMGLILLCAVWSLVLCVLTRAKTSSGQVLTESFLVRLKEIVQLVEDQKIVIENQTKIINEQRALITSFVERSEQSLRLSSVAFEECNRIQVWMIFVVTQTISIQMLYEILLFLLSLLLKS